MKKKTSLIFWILTIFLTLIGESDSAQNKQLDIEQKKNSFRVLVPDFLGIPNGIYQKISQLYLGCPRNKFLDKIQNAKNFRAPLSRFNEILNSEHPLRFFEQKFKTNGMFTDMYFQYQVDRVQGTLDNVSFWFGKENVDKPNQYEPLIKNIMDYYVQHLGEPLSSQHYIKKHTDTLSGQEHMIIFDWSLDEEESILRLIYPPLEALPKYRFYLLIIVAQGEEVQDVFPNKIPDSYKEVQPLQESQYKNYSIKIKKNE